MSAYDRDFSDAIYGKENDGRYVSKNRLINMLNHEYSLIEERLKIEDHPNTKFLLLPILSQLLIIKKKKKVMDGLVLDFKKIAILNPMISYFM